MITSDKSAKLVGVVGVGMMGHGIAASLQRGGWPIAFLNHPGNQPTDDLLDKGAVSFDTCRDLAQVCDTVIVCVTGSPQVEDVLFRDDGLLEGLRAGSVVIDCSTAIPDSTKKIGAAVEAAGGRFLDAPMTRTPKEAAEGRLNLIVGGDPAVYEAALPLMRSYAENITYAGPIGAGHTMKLLHNYVSLGFSAILAEAVASSIRAGVDPKVLADILSSGGGAGVVLDRHKPFILSNDTSSFMFSVANARKDVGYYVEMARKLGAENAAASAVHALYSDACESGHEKSVVPEMIAILAEKQTATPN